MGGEGAAGGAGHGSAGWGRRLDGGARASKALTPGRTTRVARGPARSKSSSGLLPGFVAGRPGGVSAGGCDEIAWNHADENAAVSRPGGRRTILARHPRFRSSSDIDDEEEKR